MRKGSSPKPSIYRRTESRYNGVITGNGQDLNRREHSSLDSGRVAALLKQRCPRCLEGKVFEGVFRMHERCPICGLAFEREPGYFAGAMYVSYGLGIIATLPIWLPMAWLGRPLGEVALASGSLLIVSSPALFRYARVLWLYLDHALDPR
jgi:uncharacterized protein (DUF983 family)